MYYYSGRPIALFIIYYFYNNVSADTVSNDISRLISRRKGAYPPYVCIPADPYTVNVSKTLVSRRKVAYPYYVCIPADPYTLNVSRTTVSRHKGAYPHFVCIPADLYTVNVFQSRCCRVML